MGVFNPERRTAKRVDEIHGASADQIEADRIDQQLHPIGFTDAVIAISSIGQIEYVLKTRTAAPFD